MRIFLTAVVILLSCWLLPTRVAHAIDTGRRCCIFKLEAPESDPDPDFKATGATYLPASDRVFVVYRDGYVALLDAATTHCGEWERGRPGLSPSELRPWGERRFQGVTTSSATPFLDVTSPSATELPVVLLELPTEGVPALHAMDLGIMDITWSLDITEGPIGEFGGGVAWVADGTSEGRFLFSLGSGDIAIYQVTVSPPAATYLETIRLPGIESDATDLTGLYYYVRQSGPAELWAYFFAIDTFYVFAMDKDGTVAGTAHTETGHMSIDRGNPENPMGIAVIDHPTDPDMVRVFVANEGSWVYELWWRRGGSRFTECPWHDTNLKACCFTETSSCEELTRNECNAADGEYTDDFKAWGNPRPLCVPDACKSVFGDTSGGDSDGGCSNAPARGHSVWPIGVIGLLILVGRRRRRPLPEQTHD